MHISLELKTLLKNLYKCSEIKLGYTQNSNYILPLLEVETGFLVLSIFSYGLGRFPAQSNRIQKILSDQRMFSLPPI